jgi:hypothetical protein
MAWVSLLQPTGDVATPRLGFARLLIGTMGVLLTLQAFPVAGNQLAWGSLGLVVVGVLILDDGLVLLRSHAASNYRLTLRLLNDHVRRIVPSTAVVALVLLLLVGNARYALASDHAAFDAHRSVALPGVQDLHLQAEDTATFQQMSSLLRSHCSTFQSLPGLNSFYFFTGLPPPTDLNTTQWMYLFDDGTQQRIVDRLREIPRLCVLEDADMALLWRVHADKPLPQDSPLLRYIRASFVPFQQVGPLVLLTRGPEGTLGPTAAVPLCDGGPHSVPLCQ